MKREFNKLNPLKNYGSGDAPDIPPCADVIGLYTFLRNPKVMKALNINTTENSLPDWNECSNIEYER